MILRGQEHINNELMLEPGDSFRVCVTDTTHNTTETMQELNGQWFTVHHRQKSNQNIYNAYAHVAENSIYKWFWYHMDAIDKPNYAPSKPSSVKSGTLPLF